MKRACSTYLFRFSLKRAYDLLDQVASENQNYIDCHSVIQH